VWSKGVTVDERWAPKRAGDIDPVADHEDNPQYEVHTGRVIQHPDGPRRYVSLWLGAEGRWCGWLAAGEPV
jgi:hypothetical protein